MKKVFLIGLLALTACAAQKTPEQIAEEQRAWDQYQMELSRIKITKNEPSNCKYISSISSTAYGKLFTPATYDEATAKLKEEAWKKRANTAVIDDMQQPRNTGVGANNPGHHFIIQARLFDCP